MPIPTKTRKTKILLALLAVVLVLILACVVYGLVHNRADTAIPSVTPRPTPEVIVREKEVEKIVEVEKQITADVLQESLRDIGTLVTEEYAFTEVIHYSSVRKLMNKELGITESSFLASYDGVVTAGIDLADVTVQKDESDGSITIILPVAEIRDVAIDKNSFELYSEKEGLWNPISVKDYNDSLIELENSARDKALDKGLLERADANAKRVVENFARSLLGSAAYTLQLETKSK